MQGHDTSEPSLVISAQFGKDDARSRIHDANEEECFLQKLALCFTKTKKITWNFVTMLRPWIVFIVIIIIV